MIFCKKKKLIGGKPLRIIFNKVDRFISDNVGTKYLVLFGSEKYYVIFHRIRFAIRLKSNISVLFLIIMQKSILIQMIICW